MRHLLFIIILFGGFCQSSFCQKKELQISIVDSTSGQPISNSVLIIQPGNINALSDQDGFLKQHLAPGSYTIEIQIIGYKNTIENINVSYDTSITIQVTPKIFPIDQVSVFSDSIKFVSISKDGGFIIDPKTINETPNQFSEPDIIKFIQTLPGVVSGKEGSSEMFIRGGSAGQNISYSNGASFFLPNHLMGSISPFDAEFISSIELLKDFVPASYGGGLSSIMNIKYKKSNLDSVSARLRLGFLSSGGQLDIPIVKERAGIILGAKMSNYSVYYPILNSLAGKTITGFIPPSNYSYLNSFLKLNYKFNSGSEINYLLLVNLDSGKEETIFNYSKNDTIFEERNSSTNGWNSIVHSIRWENSNLENLIYTLDANYSIFHSTRDISIQNLIISDTEDYLVKDQGSSQFSPSNRNIQLNLSIRNKSSSLSGGVGVRLRDFDSNIFTSYDFGDNVISNRIDLDYLLIEPTIFFMSTMNLSNKISVDIGIRNYAILTGNKTYFSAEPRLRIAYKPNKTIDFHLCYTRLSQDDHSIEGSNVGLRSSIWLPVTENLGPSKSDNFSISCIGTDIDQFDLIGSVYYRSLRNIYEIKPGASFLRNEPIEEKFEAINGFAYGIEAGIIKSKGNMKGSISYTYSRSFREWNVSMEDRFIPSASDRPHNLNINCKYFLNRKHSFGLNWKYSSGIPATIYMHQSSVAQWFSHKNNIRYRPYHSLDISYKRKVYFSRFTSIIDFNITNLYNRRNTYYLQKDYDNALNRTVLRNISLFPIMPTLSLSIII